MPVQAGSGCASKGHGLLMVMTRRGMGRRMLPAALSALTQQAT